MTFNIYVTLQGVGGTCEVPNNLNPVECANFPSLLVRLAETLPQLSLGLEYVGMRIERIDEPSRR